MKQIREDIEEMMSLMISSYRLSNGSDPDQVTLTTNSYNLLKHKDPISKKIVSPLTFRGVRINVI